MRCPSSQSYAPGYGAICIARPTNETAHGHAPQVERRSERSGAPMTPSPLRSRLGSTESQPARSGERSAAPTKPSSSKSAGHGGVPRETSSTDGDAMPSSLMAEPRLNRPSSDIVSPKYVQFVGSWNPFSADHCESGTYPRTLNQRYVADITYTASAIVPSTFESVTAPRPAGAGIMA